MSLLGLALGWVAGSLFRIRRRHVEEAMTRAGIADVPAAAAAMYRRLGVALVQLLGGAGDVAVETAALDRDGPVVIFASHTDNWELAAAGAARHLRARGRALCVVAKPMHSAFFDRWLAHVRAARGVRVIPPAGALAAATSALARGDVVAMPIDQVPDRAAHGLWLDFLGAPALVDRAPATVAWRARATVLVVAGGRVIDVIPAARRSDRGRTWIAATTRRATAALERAILADPASWMWLHRRWKRPAPLGFPARAE